MFRTIGLGSLSHKPNPLHVYTPRHLQAHHSTVLLQNHKTLLHYSTLSESMRLRPHFSALRNLSLGT